MIMACSKSATSVGVLAKKQAERRRGGDAKLGVHWEPSSGHLSEVGALPAHGREQAEGQNEGEGRCGLVCVKKSRVAERQTVRPTALVSRSAAGGYLT